MGRTIAIGDIHGCYDELRRLLEKMAVQPDDRVISVGDLTVKGPHSSRVVELFASDPRFSAVIGNHDLALVKHWRDPNVTLKPQQQLAFEELSTAGTCLDYLASLPYFEELGSHVVVHAGLRPGVRLANQTPEDLTELRTLSEDRTSREGLAWYEVYEGPKTALFGHWPAAEPRRAPHAIGLDTGCVYGYLLTAYIIETDEFVQVRANKVYSDPSRKGQ